VGGDVSVESLIFVDVVVSLLCLDEVFTEFDVGQSFAAESHLLLHDLEHFFVADAWLERTFTLFGHILEYIVIL